MNPDGTLTPEMIKKAKQIFDRRTFGNEPISLGLHYDILPPPDQEGRQIIGLVTGNKYEAVLIDGVLQWQPA